MQLVFRTYSEPVYRRRFLVFDKIIVKEFLLDAAELAMYGEKRVALENFLENLLENEIHISSELIDLAEEAFSDNPTDYDNRLIFEMKQFKLN